MEDPAVELARIIDPGRGPFCDIDKQGNPMPMPPTRRDPVMDREHNPRAVRHPGKTRQDYQPKDQRERVQMVDRQRQWAREKRPTCSGDYAKLPR